MRSAVIERKTNETNIKLVLELDGQGKLRGTSGIGFFDHMLTALCKHAHFNLQVEMSGDLVVDGHHTVEDLGLCLGQAFNEALGDKIGIRRFGTALIPMDESLAQAVIDISGRPFLHFDAPLAAGMLGTFDLELVEEFFRAFSNEAKLTFHLRLLYGSNSHHKVEALFKAAARALAEAVSTDEKESGVPSSKGVL